MEKSINIFETATRNKVRFRSSVGALSVEDLWVLPLTSKTKVNLNSIAKALSKELRESSEDNFVGEKSPNTTTIELKLDIVKHIICVKLEDIEKRKVNKSKKEQKNIILDIIAKKQNQELEGKSIAELMKMVEE